MDAVSSVQHSDKKFASKFAKKFTVYHLFTINGQQYNGQRYNSQWYNSYRYNGQQSESNFGVTTTTTLPHPLQ